MKEYRIVCTRDTIHYNGMKTHHDEVAPMNEGGCHYETYGTKAEAVKALARMKKTCREYEEGTVYGTMTLLKIERV